MNNSGFFIFWGTMLALFFLVSSNADRFFIVLYRITAFVAVILFLLYFALGAQPRMWG